MSGDSQRPVVIDGPTLRAARLAYGKTMRSVATVAKMSHSHLSKVENGENGRPVTPRILYAYEKVLGVNLRHAVASGSLTDASPPRWLPGQMTDLQRRTFRTQVASAAVGGSNTAAAWAMLRKVGQVAIPEQVDQEQIASLEQITAQLEGLGGLAGEVAHQLLAWLIHLRSDGPAEQRLQAVVARLCRRAAHGMVAAGRVESGRILYLLALEYAAVADHPELRALALADVAAEHVDLGYAKDALGLLRIAEGDERLGEETRARLKSVRVRAEALQLEPGG